MKIERAYLLDIDGKEFNSKYINDYDVTFIVDASIEYQNIILVLSKNVDKVKFKVFDGKEHKPVPEFTVNQETNRIKINEKFKGANLINKVENGAELKIELIDKYGETVTYYIYAEEDH